MANDFSLTALFGGNTAPLEQSCKRAAAAVTDFTSKAAKNGFGDLIAPIGKVAAAVGSVGAVMAGLKGALELGAEMQDASNRTGIAVQNVVGLRKAFKDAGVDAEALPGAINKMQRSLAGMGKGGGAATSVLHGLGLDPQQLASAKPDEAFRKIGEAINNLPNSTERAAAAMAIFGKSGGELLQVFASPAFRDAGNISNTARLLGENAASFKEAHEALSHVGSKLSGFFVGIASGFIPELGEVIDQFEKIDLSPIGEGLGNAIGNFVTNFGKAWGVLGQAMAQTFDIIFSKDSLVAFSAEFLIIASKFGDAVIRALKTPLDYLQAGMQYAVEKVMESLGKIPMVGKALGLSEFKSSSYGEIFKQIHSGKNGLEELTSGGDQARSDLANGVNLKDKIAKIVNDIGAAFKPVVTATAETKKANEEGRRKAKEKYGVDLTQGAFDPSDLGGKASIVADSFAKIGGGGTSSFLGVLDVNRQQLQAQQQTNRLLEQYLKSGGISGAALAH